MADLSRRGAQINYSVGCQPSSVAATFCFQPGHIRSWRGSREAYALSLIAAARRWLLLLLLPLLSAAVG
jgi:hypothetical protein